MQGIYTYIPETNYAPREYSVAGILLLLFMVLISLVSVLLFQYYYYYYYYYYYCVTGVQCQLFQQECRYYDIRLQTTQTSVNQTSELCH